MDAFHQVHRAEQIGLARPWRPTALVDARHSSLLAKDHRAARQGIWIVGVTDTNAFDTGNCKSLLVVLRIPVLECFVGDIYNLTLKRFTCIKFSSGVSCSCVSAFKPDFFVHFRR